MSEEKEEGLVDAGRFLRAKKCLMIGAIIFYACAIALSIVGYIHSPILSDIAIAPLFLGALLTGFLGGLAMAGK